MYFKNHLLQLICFALFVVATVNFASAQTQKIKSLEIDNGGGNSAPVPLWIKTPAVGALTDSVLTWNPADSSMRMISVGLKLGDWFVSGTTSTPATNTDDQYVMGRVAIGSNAEFGTPTIPLTSVRTWPILAVLGGDAIINYMTVGLGGGQRLTNAATGFNAVYYTN